ncbi:MAG: hypothetical protein ACRDS9_04725 [Pseudonocardiaceae bacterium]
MSAIIDAGASTKLITTDNSSSLWIATKGLRNQSYSVRSGRARRRHHPDSAGQHPFI